MEVVKIECLEEGPGRRRPGDGGLDLLLVLKGRVDWIMPELGHRRQLAGEWSLHTSARMESRIECGQVEGIRIGAELGPMDRMHLEGRGLPPRLACLACPQRDPVFHVGGRATLEMRQVVCELVKPPSGRLGNQLMRKAWALELLARVMESPELQGKPPCGACQAGKDQEALQSVARYLEENFGESHSIPGLARRHYINEFKLKKGFRENFGTTVFAYLRQVRMREAHRLLARDRATVIEAANAVGYTNPSHFARAFRSQHGINPGELLREV